MKTKFKLFASVIGLILLMVLGHRCTAQNNPNFFLNGTFNGVRAYHLFSLRPTTVFGASITGPTVVAGTGAGTGPTVAMNGTDVSGVFLVVTGTVPAANAIIFTATFISSYVGQVSATGYKRNGVSVVNPNNFPVCIITPGNAVTASLPLASIPFIANDATLLGQTGFNFMSNTAALTASTTYQWYYIIIN